MFDEIKKQFKENPLGAATVGAIVLSTLVSVVNTANNTRNSRSWAREVKRRDRMTK